MPEFLFDTARDALLFSFRYCNQQYAKAPELVKGRVIGSGKGLRGLDGAGQAGFISQEVRALGQLHHHVLVARFTDRFTQCSMCGSAAHTGEWLGVCRWLTEEMRKELAPEAHIRLMDLLVQRHFSYQKRTLADISTQFGDGESKVKHYNAKLVPALKKIESVAQAKIEERLTALGIVESDGVEHVA